LTPPKVHLCLRLSMGVERVERVEQRDPSYHTIDDPSEPRMMRNTAHDYRRDAT
jgi:hypothetical protein